MVYNKTINVLYIECLNLNTMSKIKSFIRTTGFLLTTILFSFLLNLNCSAEQTGIAAKSQSIEMMEDQVGVTEHEIPYTLIFSVALFIFVSIITFFLVRHYKKPKG
jgi:hypothetical protein